MERLKYLVLNEPLYRYVCAQRSGAEDPVLTALRAETAALGDDARMQISVEQGAFMQLMAAALGARSALEIGTFTGYSSICLARGMGPEGRLLCLDVSREWTEVARRYWRQAGVEDRIELRLSPALDSLQALESDRQFDLVFIDALKTEYEAYYECVLPRVRPNGVILFDNMLWSGRLLNLAEGDDDGKAIDALNRKLAGDARVESVLLPFADGLMFCRKR